MSITERLSRIAFKWLGKAQFARLRAAYLALRKRLAPLLLRLHGRFDAPELRRHLQAQLPADFEILMVHSSMNKLAPMYQQDVLTLLRMLVDLCGPTHTLAMPAFYFGDPRFAGARDTFANRPRLDLKRTPSQTGLLTEMFRRLPGVRCSRHPVYRVCALGPLAVELTTGHECAASSAGAGSPFDVMARRRTVILGLGSTPEVLTQVHHAEDVLGAEFPVPRSSAEPIRMTLVDGEQEIPFDFGRSSLTWRRNMARVTRIMSVTDLRQWRFHGVPMFLTTAAAVSTTLIAAARRGETIYEQA